MAQEDVIRFALAIPHTPWIPERVASFSRLRDLLGFRPEFYKVFSDREPNHVWSEKLWRWSTVTGATHLVQLQDDVIVCENFWVHLRAMVEAVPDRPIGLESVFEAETPWYATGDGMIGVGYVLPVPLVVEMLTWRSQLRPGSVESLNEDQLIGLFCFDRWVPIWHPCPTVIDHDTELASTYGNDGHSHRRPARSLVRGDAAPETWTAPEQVPHVARVYAATPRLLRRYAPWYSFERYVEDTK